MMVLTTFILTSALTMGTTTAFATQSSILATTTTTRLDANAGMDSQLNWPKQPMEGHNMQQ